ncbi:MAG: DUF2905 domain-containing protein [Myxococcales bacterium]
MKTGDPGGLRYGCHVMSGIGRYLLIAGLVLAGVGLVLMLGEKIGLGRLPGDLVWKRKNTTIHFPIVTSIVISLVLTVLLNLFLRRK